MEIRAARASDLDAIRACAEAAYAPYIDRIGRKPAPMVADFATHIVAGQVHVAVSAEALLGYIVFFTRGDTMFWKTSPCGPRRMGTVWAERSFRFTRLKLGRLGRCGLRSTPTRKWSTTSRFIRVLATGRWAVGLRTGLIGCFSRSGFETKMSDAALDASVRLQIITADRLEYWCVRSLSKIT